MIQIQTTRSTFSFLFMTALLFVGAGVARSAPTLKAYVAATGDDANACTVEKPCLSVARALSLVTDVGIVTIIENGDYADFAITDAGHPRFLTIEAAPGIIATIRGDHSHPAIAIQAGSQDGIILRGLHLETDYGNVGIACSRARALYVESCFINRFNFGLDFGASGRLFVTDTNFKRDSTGIRVKPGANPASASINHCRIEDGTVGLDVEEGADVVIRDSVIANNVGYGVMCKSGLSVKTTNVFVENCSINGCATACSEGVGILADGTGGFTKVWVSNTTVTQHRVGVQIGLRANVYSFQNNRIAGNGLDVQGGALRSLPLT